MFLQCRLKNLSDVKVKTIGVFQAESKINQQICIGIFVQLNAQASAYSGVYVFILSIAGF